MKVSVVTISYNQAQFLDACLDSVAAQKGPWEHIIVDPGSNDGSRQIIERRREQFSHIIFEPDEGPADGLNKGFDCATGDIYFYLNSDDVILPGAFEEARVIFSEYSQLGVLAGSGSFIDEKGYSFRRVWSDPIGRVRLAYGGGNLVQPATFIRAKNFMQVGGFSKENRSNWDGGLVTDLFLAGSSFKIVDRAWAGYRLHAGTITSSAKLLDQIKAWSLQRVRKLDVSFPKAVERLLIAYFRLERIARHPTIIAARLRHGRVFGRDDR